MRLRTVIAGACVLFGCAACGFKGPLYLPQQNAAVVTHRAAQTKVTTPAEKSAAARKSKRNTGAEGTATPP